MSNFLRVITLNNFPSHAKLQCHLWYSNTFQKLLGISKEEMLFAEGSLSEVVRAKNLQKYFEGGKGYQNFKTCLD